VSFLRHGESIDPMLKSKAGSGICPPLPALIGVDEFQPVIPWRVDLHQSPPSLHRPGSECATVILPVEVFAANGEQSLNRLSQPRGQPHFDHHSLYKTAQYHSRFVKESVMKFTYQNQKHPGTFRLTILDDRPVTSDVALPDIARVCTKDCSDLTLRNGRYEGVKENVQSKGIDTTWDVLMFRPQMVVISRAGVEGKRKGIYTNGSLLFPSELLVQGRRG
jgi:hypothetical protein